MNQTTTKPTYDLEKRTLEFAKSMIRFCRKIKKDCISTELIKQIIRSSGSVGANYIEANEALSKKDFVHRVKISRKEAKETVYWLELIREDNKDLNDDIILLLQEAVELKKILSAIVEKSK